MGQEDAKNDPLAEARREAQREGDEKVAKALSPRQRVLVWVIDRNEEDEGPQLWDIPFSVDKDFVNLCLDEDTKEIIYPDDPEEGHDLRFYKEGTGMMTKYPASRMKLLDASPLHEDADVAEEWLEFIKENPVPDTLQFYTADQISAAFDGHVRTADSDDDEEDKPRKRSRDDDEDEKPRRKASRDDDEDEKPAKKKSSRNDDEDEEEVKPKKRERVREDDDEADEDEKPAKKKAVVDDDDEEAEDEKPKQSLRERLAARRKSSKSDDEDDD
jgi:hypothetical protein